MLELELLLAADRWRQLLLPARPMRVQPPQRLCPRAHESIGSFQASQHSDCGDNTVRKLQHMYDESQILQTKNQTEQYKANTSI